MQTVEEILADKFHKMNIGIYDEEGTSGNIFLDELPDKIPEKNEELISIYKTGSFTRENKLNGGVLKPIITIYVKGRNLLNTSKKADKIAFEISELEWETNDYYVYNLFIFSEPVRILRDEKDNYVFTFQVILNLEIK